MGLKEEDLRGDPRRSTHRQPALCIILKVTEAGGFVARHLAAIQRLTDRTGLTLDLGRSNGECHLILPTHYCAIRAQALAVRLSTLTDERGRNVLEAEVSQQSGMARTGAAPLMPLPAATNT